MAKVQISIDDKLLSRIDAYADEVFTSRSGLISIGMSEFLNQKEVLSLIKGLGLAVQKIADTGTVDNDTLNELQDFERLCKLITK